MATASFSKRLDRIEAAIAPERQSVIAFEYSSDVTETDVEAFVRDVLKPHPSQPLIAIKCTHEPRPHDIGSPPAPTFIRRISP